MDSYLQYKYEHRYDDYFFDGHASYDGKTIVGIYVMGKNLKDALKNFESESGIKILGMGEVTDNIKNTWRVNYPKMVIPDSFAFPHTGDSVNDCRICEKNDLFAMQHFIYGKSFKDILEIEKEYADALAKDELKAKQEEEDRQRELTRQRKIRMEREEREERERAYREQQERERRNQCYTPSDDKMTVTGYKREWCGGDEGWVKTKYTYTVDRNKYGL